MNKFYTNLVTWKKLSLLSIGFFFFFFAAAQVFMKPFSEDLLSNLMSGKNIVPVVNANEISFKKDFPESKGNNVKNAEDKINIAALLTLNAAKNASTKSFIKENAVASPFYETLAGPGGPILVVTSNSNLFSTYAAEILQAEGLNEYATSDVGALSTSMLSGYDVVVVGDIALTDAQVNLLSNWTTAGGTLIAFSPDPKLAPLLGLNPTGNTLANRYLLVNTSTGPGKGIVNQTMQYQSVADLYTLNGATSLATLYSNATTATNNPAVTTRNVGTSGGKAVAFTYDLARSVVYTRQGNPDWAGTERDGQAGPIRSDDQFYPDWINLSKVAIPQADEQQRLFVNIILQSSRKPMPRFWYLPRGLKAAVVMTGDDHANGGTKARFNQYLQASSDNSAEAVADWRAIRGTSYIYPNTPISDSEARAFEQQGFEVALHLSTNCDNFTPASLDRDLTEQLASFGARFPSVAAPVTNRTHCIAWSDWHTQPQLEAPKGIRLDANYYYWPGEWVQDRPGMFSGSGIPMRFTQLNGTLIDCYQLTTQMTDESDLSYSYHIDQLLDKALGPEGYYGVFCANMHTDADFSDGSDAIVASAKARNVPIISAKQLLTWLDGRNGSSFGGMSWNGTQLNFSASVASGARSLQGMLPITEATGQLVSLTVNGTSVAYRIEKIKGIEYAFFTCTPGNYVATYDPNSSPNNEPIVAITSPANNASFTAPASITINANATDSDGTISKVEFFQGPTKLGEDLSSPYSFVWNSVAGGSYSLTAKATDNLGLVTTSEAVIITVAAACPCSVFQASDAPAGGAQGNPYYDGGPIEVGMKFRSSVNGNVTGVRFYKQTGNTGTHIGRLYSSTGNLLAEAPFVSETATGWQQVNFASAVPITANTVYTVTYHSSNGFYSGSNSYFGSAVNRPPLSALANSESVNGVYKYGAPGFPTESFGSSNYWVDVVFNNGTPPANQLPTVAISSPANNATFTAPATINITATAADADGTVTKVEFFQGNTLLGEDASSPYTFSWEGVAAGTYSLTAKATDNLGGVKTSDAVSVKVNALPTVSITAPANGAIFTAPATITINATAADADGTIAKVEFFQSSTPGSTTKIGEDSSGPFTVSWSNVPAGDYTLTAIATDNNEGTTTSAAVSVTVNAPNNQTPTVSITSPANNATFTAPASINITATAADADGSVAKVDFYNGTTLLGTDATSPYSFSWGNVAAGTYSLTARATDNGNAVTTSAAVSVTVNNVSVSCPCTVFKPTDAPANGPLNDGRALQLGMKFRSSVNGFVTGVRFYKAIGNNGTHIGQLYSNTGTLLAQVTFINETASGWQQMDFPTAVPINANTTYTISYHSSNGTYSGQELGFSQAIVNSPLTGLQNGTDGANGVYRYTNVPARPTTGYRSSNYYVDAVFNTSIPGANTAVALTSSKAPSMEELQKQEEFEVYPNPFSGMATVSFVLDKNDAYTVGLYDAKGRMVELLKQGQAKSGEPTTIALDGSKLAKGLYLIRLQTSTGIKVKKLVLDK